MEERENIHKGFKIFIIIFTIIVLLFINRGKIIEIFQRKDMDLSLYETIEDDFQYRFFNGDIIRYNDDGIAYLEDFNRVTTQKDFNFEDPLIEFADKYIYYASGATGDVYVLNNRLETISQFTLNMNIFNIEETSRYIMVHSKGEEETLVTIDIEGNILYKNIPEKNILNYDMGRNTYAFSTLVIEDDILSILNIYDFQGQIVDSMEFKNEVIFKLYYLEEDILLLTDKGLYMIKDRQILWEKEFPLIKNIIIDKGKIQLLYSNCLETLDFLGQSISILEFEEEYDMITSMEDGLILYGEKDILIIKDEENYKLSLDHKINDVSGYNNQIIVNTEEYTYIYDMKITEGEER